MIEIKVNLNVAKFFILYIIIYYMLNLKILDFI